MLDEAFTAIGLIAWCANPSLNFDLISCFTLNTIRREIRRRPLKANFAESNFSSVTLNSGSFREFSYETLIFITRGDQSLIALQSERIDASAFSCWRNASKVRYPNVAPLQAVCTSDE